MARRIYKATNGAQFSKGDAQVYGECLAKISKENEGTLKPIDVVEEARETNSPLHDYFDWDDSSAGEKYRVEQARHLINHITVIIKHDHTQREQRAYFSVNETPDERRLNKVYVTVERVLSEPALRKQILLRAIKEAEYWQERYSEYKELERIFNAIELTKRKIRKKLVKKKVAKRRKTISARIRR